MPGQHKKSDKDSLLLDLYQEKLRYLVEERKLNEKWSWEDVLQRWQFHAPEELGIPVETMELSLQHAEETLEKCPAYENHTISSMIEIAKLGKNPLKQDDAKDRDPIVVAAQEMAHILSAHPESDFVLSAITSKEDGLDMSFQLGSETLPESALVAMVQSAYGQVEYQAVAETANVYPYQCYAEAKTVVRSKQEIEKMPMEQKFHSWVTLVFSALSCNQNAMVKMQFHPLIKERDYDFLADQTTILENLYQEFSLLNEVTWNNGINGGGNLTVKDGTLHKLVKGAKVISNAINDGYQISETYSFSYAKSSKIIQQRIVRVMAEIEHQLIRLRQIKNSLGWALSISISAKEEDTIDALTSIISGFAKQANYSLTWQQTPCYAMVGTGSDVQAFFMFPTKEFPGFEFIENENFSLISPVASKEGLYIGDILWNNSKVSPFYIPQQILNRHAFICGMTGAGKTNTLFKIIEEIATPFLIIEPVKGEYRSLQRYYEDVQVLTMRTSDATSAQVSILQMNPFWFPVGANLSFHIDSIKTIIASAFDLSAAMPNILEQCLYNIYLKLGWNIITNENAYVDILPSEYLYPTFTDLTNEVENYLNQSDFGEEVLGNYKGALLSRLKSFTNGSKGALLNTTKHLDYTKMIAGRYILELEGLSDDADKCLVMGTVLVQYYQQLKAQLSNKEKAGLKHIIVIEEAHRLFKNVTQQNKNAEGADPTGQLVESLSNIMAEIRAFGEGMLIVDQSPSKVSEDVINNSGTKIVHRIDNEKNIKMLQSALLLPNNVVGFSALAQGEALIRSDGMLRPCKVKMMCSGIKEGYALADSFKTSELSDFSINDCFIANSILQNENIYRDISAQIKKLIRTFIWMDWSDWATVVNQFLLAIVNVLMEGYTFDRVQGRFNVLVELISICIKKVYSTGSTKQMGLIHLFVMRVLELYADYKNGVQVKTAALALLEQYFKENLSGDTLYANKGKLYVYSAYQHFGSIFNMDLAEDKSYSLFSYLWKSVNDLNNDEAVSCILEYTSIEHYFQSNTYLPVEKYGRLYADMQEKLNDFLSNTEYLDEMIAIEDKEI